MAHRPVLEGAEPLPPVTLRVATAADEPFLRALYRSTRIDELSPLGWSEAQVDAFCDFQFIAQAQGYRQAYPGAEHLILGFQGEDVGRMIKSRTSSELMLVDLALQPAFRNRGLGRFVVAGLQEEARSASTPLLLHVERSSRAVAFYQRLGFAVVAEDDLRFTMRWSGVGVFQ
jgi:GNAT superfamily N-acetyltransferase